MLNTQIQEAEFENVKLLSKKWQATTQQHLTPQSSYVNHVLAIRQLKVAQIVQIMFK